MQQNKTPRESNMDSQENDPSKAIGKKMMIVAWLLGLGLLTFAFGGWEERQINPNSTPSSRLTEDGAEVILKSSRGGHYLTTGIINQNEVTFLLDTGATDVAVPGALNRVLQLKLGNKHYAHTANGTAEAYYTTIEKLSIGDIHLYNVNASVIPNMQGEEVLLGMSVLKQLEFSQKDKELSLRQAR